MSGITQASGLPYRVRYITQLWRSSRPNSSMATGTASRRIQAARFLGRPSRVSHTTRITARAKPSMARPVSLTSVRVPAPRHRLIRSP